MKYLLLIALLFTSVSQAQWSYSDKNKADDGYMASTMATNYDNILLGVYCNPISNKYQILLSISEDRAGFEENSKNNFKYQFNTDPTKTMSMLAGPKGEVMNLYMFTTYADIFLSGLVAKDTLKLEMTKGDKVIYPTFSLTGSGTQIIRVLDVCIKERANKKDKGFTKPVDAGFI